MNIDYQGLSVLLGALAAFITVVGGFALQVAIFVRQGHAIAASKELHASVNGQTAELKHAIAQVGYDAGEKAGIASERLNPQVDTPKIIAS